MHVVPRPGTWLAVCCLLLATAALAQQPAITPQATIDQTKLQQGGYPLPDVLRSGERFNRQFCFAFP